jgi:hypothetical protein
VSASTELRPINTRSKVPSVSIAAASALAVAQVSLPAKAGSVMCTPWSAPKAMASRSTLSALGGPSVMTVRVPPVAWANACPWATARRQ